jgi:hypothetical protein
MLKIIMKCAVTICCILWLVGCVTSAKNMSNGSSPSSDELRVKTQGILDRSAKGNLKEFIEIDKISMYTKGKTGEYTKVPVLDFVALDMMADLFAGCQIASIVSLENWDSRSMEKLQQICINSVDAKDSLVVLNHNEKNYQGGILFYSKNGKWFIRSFFFIPKRIF